MDLDDVQQSLRDLVREFFDGHSYTEVTWKKTPKGREIPGLVVARFGSGPRSRLFTYISLGAWNTRPETEACIEFILCADQPNDRHVELLNMIAWYHREYRLGVGHTVPIGEPWLPNSKLEFFLVSKPYPFGPRLEICNTTDISISFLWLLPITRAEKEFAKTNGQEALERQFDKHALKYWDARRASVV